MEPLQWKLYSVKRPVLMARQSDWVDFGSLGEALGLFELLARLVSDGRRGSARNSIRKWAVDLFFTGYAEERYPIGEGHSKLLESLMLWSLVAFGLSQLMANVKWQFTVALATASLAERR